MKATRMIGLTAAAAALAGCITQRAAPTAELRVIYERSAQYHLPDRNPVIVIPGILGTRLVDADSGRVVWGAFSGASVNPRDLDDARLVALPVEEGLPLSALVDSVQPDGVLEQVEVNLFGIPIDIQAYVGILSALGVGGYRDESLGLNAIDYGDGHFTCFQFDYDWRRDNVENAQRLQAFIDEKRAYIQAEYRERYGIENAEIKFDIVAHSMGGLVTRYFLRYGDADLREDGEPPEVTWAGAEDVERAILIGTPNAGALSALDQLVNGYDVGRPILPLYPSALLGTFPSIFELLPRSRHRLVVWDGDPEKPVEDLLDPELWERFGWGLAARDQRTERLLEAFVEGVDDPEARRQIALELQETILWRAETFQEAIDVPADPPEGLGLYLVAGDAEATASLVSVDSETGDIKVIDTAPGDGTVLRASALMDERLDGEWRPTLRSPIDWTAVQFVFANHLGLTSDPGFTDNVLYLLLEEPR